MTASTSSDAPFRTERGVLTRSTWMSRAQLRAADADGEDGQLFGLEVQERVGERRLARVGAVGDEHDSSDRQPGQLFADAIERRADLRLRAGKGEVLHRIDASRRGREAERPHQEAFGERLQQRARVGGKFLAQELGARLVVGPVGNLHAPRVVQQYGDDVLLRDGGLDDQRWTEETEDDERQRGHAKHREHHAIARAAVHADAAIGQDGARP